MITSAQAPGKIILVGEHAVVYGRPAIAIPIFDVQAAARIEDGPPGRGCWIVAPQIGLHAPLATLGDEHPLALVLRLVLDHAQLSSPPDWTVTVTSQIPIASGLGSGAAISAALVRAALQHLTATPDAPIDPAVVSRLVFAGEELYHGTPSGIDNTVVAYAMPIWFMTGRDPARFEPARPFSFVIADSGIPAPTKETVGAVRRQWLAEPQRYEALFDAIAGVVADAHHALITGQADQLGRLFDRNQLLLGQLGVSSPGLETLIAAARGAGAMGAKLSGGGQGGNIIALVDDESAPAVVDALTAAGAKNVLVTHLAPTIPRDLRP